MSNQQHLARICKADIALEGVRDDLTTRDRMPPLDADTIGAVADLIDKARTSLRYARFILEGSAD